MTLRSLSIALAASLAVLLGAATASATPARTAPEARTAPKVKFHRGALKGLGMNKATTTPKKATSPRLQHHNARKALRHRAPGLHRLGHATPNPPPRTAAKARLPRSAPVILHQPLPTMNRKDLSGRFPPRPRRR